LSSTEDNKQSQDPVFYQICNYCSGRLIIMIMMNIRTIRKNYTIKIRLTVTKTQNMHL